MNLQAITKTQMATLLDQLLHGQTNPNLLIADTNNNITIATKANYLTANAWYLNS